MNESWQAKIAEIYQKIIVIYQIKPVFQKEKTRLIKYIKEDNW